MLELYIRGVVDEMDNMRLDIESVTPCACSSLRTDSC